MIQQNLVQGTSEWLQMRRKYLGASDAPIYMGISPWRTRFQLWQDKLGIGQPQKETEAMRVGKIMEETARKVYCDLTGLNVEPEVVFHSEIPYFMASLDGLNKNLKIAVEIKCPGHEAHSMAKAGVVPVYYYPQLQHQMACLGYDHIDYFSYKNGDFTLIKVPRDEEYIKALYNEAAAFWECVLTLTPPALTSRDYVDRSHIAQWRFNADEMKTISEQIKRLEEKQDALRNWFIDASDNQNSKGYGIYLTKYSRKGKLDQNKIKEKFDIDLDLYRADASDGWRLTFKD